MTCRNCYHFDVCNTWKMAGTENLEGKPETLFDVFGSEAEKSCRFFVDNKKVLNLPCAVGETVYKVVAQHDNFDDSKYVRIIQVPFHMNLLDEIGKTIFLTPEEANAKNN